MKAYIAGPMTGHENCNREAFHDASTTLTQLGYTTLNPALLPDGLSQPEYMDICFAMVRAADVVVFLSGWVESAGAQAEYHYAKKLGITLICAETGDPV